MTNSLFTKIMVVTHTESSSKRRLTLALKGERDIEERVPYFALNLELNFRVLIRL